MVRSFFVHDEREGGHLVRWGGSVKITIALLSLFTSVLSAETKAPVVKPAPNPARLPTAANVAYGSHERQVLDFYKAESAKPDTPAKTP